MCNVDESKTGVYVCVEEKISADMPIVALRFIGSETGELIPTHLVLGKKTYEVSNTTFRDGINDVCNAAQEAMNTVRESVEVIKAEHAKAIQLLKEAYSAYDDTVEWTDNLKAFLAQK